MKKNYKTKAVISFILALVLSAGLLGQSGNVRIETALASEAEQNQKDINDAKSKISDLEKKQAELDEKIAETKEDISKQKENQQAIEEQIETVSETISTLNESIIALDKEMTKLAEEIAVLESEIADKKLEIDSGIDDFKGRLRAIYIAGSDSYTEILLGSSDFYDMLMKIELVKRVADHDNSEIDRLIAIKNDYEAELEKLEEKKDELTEKSTEFNAQKKKSEEQKQKLADLYSESEELIAQLEESEAAFEQNLEELQAEQEGFEADLQELYKKEEARKKKEAEEAERKRREAEAQAQAQQQQQGSSESGSGSSSGSSGESTYYPVTPTSTGFIWPVPGKYGISSYMGWRWGSFHKGIDVWAYGIRGSDVVASAGGTVIVSNNTCTHDWAKSGSCGCGGGYGNYVIIDHGNGYWTLYGHMQYTVVNTGDYVAQGQKIGVVGTTGWSTGDHCHFEVRLNGNPVDPTQYVSY